MLSVPQQVPGRQPAAAGQQVLDQQQFQGLEGVDMAGLVEHEEVSGKRKEPPSETEGEDENWGERSRLRPRSLYNPWK